ncbi:hypothetical protein VT84_05380 [Gemmata sp. SH-PL17]|nr:hypothetical protein VT84_05380 [Gemmata sp. SH-PL17]
MTWLKASSSGGEEPPSFPLPGGTGGEEPPPPAPLAPCEGEPPTGSPCNPLLPEKGEKEVSGVGAAFFDCKVPVSPFPSGRGGGGVGRGCNPSPTPPLNGEGLKTGACDAPVSAFCSAPPSFLGKGVRGLGCLCSPFPSGRGDGGVGCLRSSVGPLVETGGGTVCGARSDSHPTTTTASTNNSATRIADPPVTPGKSTARVARVHAVRGT